MHSYTARQERWCWRPRGGGKHAFDVELCDREPPEPVVRHLQVTPGQDFWQAWTRLEVVAKLTDTPVLTLLRARPEDVALPKGFRAWHVRYGDFVFCFAAQPIEVT